MSETECDDVNMPSKLKECLDKTNCVLERLGDIEGEESNCDQLSDHSEKYRLTVEVVCYGK